MNLLFRVLLVFFKSLFGRKLGTLDESVLTLRVLPGDLDALGHMNNGRYLSIMDLGRVDLMTRTGMSRAAIRRKWHPLVGSAAIRFHRPLKPFKKYQLKSRLICWDDKWFYIEQRFESEGELKALGLIKGLLRRRDENIPTAEVLKAMGAAVSSPPLPESIRRWIEMDRQAGE